MSDFQEAMREFRFLDEKRCSTGLTPAEGERWQALAGELGVDLSQLQAAPEEAAPQQPAPQGYYGPDGQWYAYPPQYDPAVWGGPQPGAWQGYYPPPPQGYYGPDGQWYPYPPPPTYYDPNTGQYYAMPQAYGYPPQWGPPQGPGQFDPSQGWPQQQGGYPPPQWPAQPGWGPPQPQYGAPPQAWPEAPAPEEQLQQDPYAQEPVPGPAVTAPFGADPEAIPDVQPDEVMEIRDEEVVEAPPSRAPAPPADPVADLRQALSMDDDVAGPAFGGLVADIDPSPHLGDAAPEPTAKVAAISPEPFRPTLVLEVPPPEPEPEVAADPTPLDPASLEVLSLDAGGFEADRFEAPPLESGPHETGPFDMTSSEGVPLETAAAETPVEAPSASWPAPPEAPEAEAAASLESVPALVAPAAPPEPALPTPPVPSPHAEAPPPEPPSAFEGLALPPIAGPIPTFTPPPTAAPSREALFDESWEETTELPTAATEDTWPPAPSGPRVEKPGPPVAEEWEAVAASAEAPVEDPGAPLELAGPADFVPWNRQPTADPQDTQDLPLAEELGDFDVISGPVAALATGVPAGGASEYEDAPLELASNSEFIPEPTRPGVGEPFTPLGAQPMELTEEVEGEVIQGEVEATPADAGELDLDVEELVPPSAPQPPLPLIRPLPPPPAEARPLPGPALRPARGFDLPPLEARPLAPPARAAPLPAPASRLPLAPTVPLPLVSAAQPFAVPPLVASTGPTFRPSGPLPPPPGPALSPPGPITAAALANRLGALNSPVPFNPPATAVAAAPASGQPEDGRVVVAGEHRVILHTMEGGVKRGAIEDADLAAAQVVLLTSPGVSETVPRDRVKAIFFMLAPGSRAPAPDGLKVRVTFRDGRQVAGYSRDHRSGAAGFFVVPADARTNTERIFIYRHGVTSVSVEG